MSNSDNTLEQEIAEQARQINRLLEEVSWKNAQLKEMAEQLSQTSQMANQCQRELRELKELNQNYLKEYQAVTSSKSWKFINLVWAYRARLLPPDSLQFKVARRMVRAVKRTVKSPVGLHSPAAALRLPPPIDPYDAWLEVNQWNGRRRDLLEKRLSRIANPPLLSVVMPVYDPPIKFLNKAIESVVNQVYQNWELCVVDDASTNPAVRELLSSWAGKDERVKIHFSEVNGNISRTTNTAVDMAKGEYVALLDNDDEITPDALAEVAIYLSAQPQTDILYSDDDKIDVNGKRFAPQFKPDWSPELLLSYMYMSHLLVMRRKLYLEAGGLRVGYEGSQDYDLALRASRLADHVGHIPKVLYHWRVLAGSTASSGAAKPNSFEAGRKAVQEHVDALGAKAIVSQPEWALKAGCGIFAHQFPDVGPRVAIIIPTKNQAHLLQACLSTLGKTTYQNYEVIIVDNESDDPETLNLLHHTIHKVIQVKNPDGAFNYAYINNYATRHTDAEYILFLNNDTEIINSSWLSQMMGYARLGGVGAVGARLLFPDGTIQHAGIVHGLYGGMAGPAFKLAHKDDPGYLSYSKVVRDYSAVTAACLLVRKELFAEVGGFDEDNFRVAYNDVDLCYRIHDLGYRIVFCPDAEITHYEGKSRGFSDRPAELAAFRKKHGRRGDPYYNPNLGLESERFPVASRTVIPSETIPPIRVLMCGASLNLEGAPNSQFEMTVHLRDKGIINPIVFCPNEGPLRSLYEERGIEVKVFEHPLARVREEQEYDKAIDEFAEKVKQWGVELIYGNTILTFYAIEAAHKLNMASVWNPRESEPWQTRFDNFDPKIAARAFKCFQYPYKVVFVAKTTEAVYLQLNSHNNFMTIHNGLDRNRLYDTLKEWPRQRARQHLKISDDRIVILLLGTVCERKGQMDLLKALQQLDENCVRRIHCFIVGDRPTDYSKELHLAHSQLDALRHSRLTIVPETFDTALYFSAADIFLCTSRVESFPRVILEAMACKLPIITTPVFGISEQVRPGINALTYDPGNIGDLTKAVSQMVDNAALRESMSGNSLAVLDNLNDYEEMVEAYGQVFKEAWLFGGSRRCVA